MANDFSAILEIIADIIIFVIKRTIDLICISIYLISFILPWRIFEELFGETDNDWRCASIISLFLTLFDCIAIPLGLISLISPLRWKHIFKGFDDYTNSNRWELRFEFIYSFFCSILDFIAIFCFILQHAFLFRINLVYYSLFIKQRTRNYIDTIIEIEIDIILLTFSAFIDCLFFIPGLIFTILVPSLWHCTYIGVKNAFTPKPSLEHIYEWDEAFWVARFILLSRVPYALYDLICLPMGFFALLSPFRNTAFRVALFEHGIESCAFGIQEYTMEDIPTFGENNIDSIPEVQATVMLDNPPSAPPVSSILPLPSIPPPSFQEQEQEQEQVQQGNIQEENQLDKEKEMESNEEKKGNDNLSVAELHENRIIQVPSTSILSSSEYKTNENITDQKIQYISSNNQNNQISSFQPIQTSVNLPSAPNQISSLSSSTTITPNYNTYTNTIPSNESRQIPLAITPAITSKPKYNAVYYNTFLRADCIYFGITALVDLILLPILLPLVVTWYRYAPIRDELFTSKSNDNLSSNRRKSLPKPWGFKEYAIISRQFCFLLLDFIFAPLLLIIFLTQYRWIPVSIVREHDDLISYRSLQVYSTLLWTFFIMIIDVITLPFALIILLTWYRSESMRIAFNNKRILFGFNSLNSSYCGCEDIDDCCLVNFAVFFIHFAVFGNFLIIIHDFIIAPILFLIGFLSGVRTYRTFFIITSSIDTSCFKRNNNNTNTNTNTNNNNNQTPSAPPMSDIEQTTPQSLQPVSSTVPIHYSLMEDTAQQQQQYQYEDNNNNNSLYNRYSLDFTTNLVYPDIFPSSTWRVHLYFEAVNSILDLPFVIIALFVMVTLWRLRTLLKNLKKVEDESPNYYRYYYRRKDYDEIDCWCCDCCCCCYGIDINWERRKIVVLEFLLLIRDIFMLIPLSLLLGTLYKIPGLILDLIGRCFPMNRNTPLLIPSSCKIIVPETHGPILIEMNCDSNVDLNIDQIKYNGQIKLFVEGSTLWSEVSRAFGDSIMRIGKSMLPLKLKEGDGVANGVITLISNNNNNSVDTDNNNNNNNQDNINNNEVISKYHVWIKLDLGPSVKRTTVLKKLNLLTKSTPIIIQLEGNSSTIGLSPVIISVIPTVDDLIKIFDNQTQYLPNSTLDRDGTIRQNILSLTPISGGLVDEFWIIIALHFGEFLLDIIHLFIVIFICMIPWRIPNLIFALFESSIRSIWREAQELYLLYQDSQQCLLDYKSNMLPLANSLAKSIKPSRTYNVYDEFILNFNEYDSYYSYNYHSRRYYNSLYYYSVDQIHKRLKLLEDLTLKRYERDSDKIIERANKGSEEIQQLGQLFSNHKEIQMMRLALWGFRFAANMMNEVEVTQLCTSLKLQHEIHNEDNFQFVSLLAEVVSNFDSSASSKEIKAQSTIETHLNYIKQRVEKENNEKSFFKHWNGLFSRSTNETRKIIRGIGYRALRDIGFIFIFLGILLTIVRILPLLRDLYQNKSFLITSPITQRILLKHFRGAAQDSKRFFTFLFFATLVLILGVGIPSFLRKLPKRMKSLEDATECAKEHLNETLSFICQLLVLFTAWKTYKLVVTAGLYAILVPPACIAEAIPRRLSSVQFRFISGVIVWISLIIGAIILSIRTDGNNGWSNNGNDNFVRNSFLAFYGSLIGIIFLSSWSLSRRKEYTNPIKESSTGFIIPSWSHIITILLGPIESIQLTSIILYFFWNGTKLYDFSTIGGSFTFPIVFLFDSNTIDSYGYSLALGLAAVCIFIWIIIVSIPLIYDNDNKSEIKSFQENSAFEFIYTLFSRIIFVSIIATLMRPYSCILNNLDNKLYISSSISQVCGGNDTIQNQFSSGIASSILLLFFMLTSTIFHSDAPDLLLLQDGGSNRINSLGQLEEPGVKFAPLYAIVIRLGQFIICYLCFGFVSLSDRRPILLIIIIISFILFLWCGFYPLGRGCSLPCISPLRAIGFLVVTWASIICYVRNSSSSNNDNDNSNNNVSWTGYVGLGIVIAGLWFIGIIFAYISQKRAEKIWQNTIKNLGLENALTELIETADLVLLEDALGGGSLEGKTNRKELFIKEIKECLTTSRLGQLLVRFEEKILAERLRYSFIQNRDEWRKSLLRNHQSDGEIGLGLTFNDVAEHARTLKNAIVPRAPLATINKHILATILENKLPEYVSWEVFKYLYDVEPIRQVLSPILSLTPDGKRPIVLTQIYGRYTWWGEEAYAVTLLRSTKRLLYTTIREHIPAPIPPSAISTTTQTTTIRNQTRNNTNTDTNNNRRSVSQSDQLELVQEEMDRSIGQQWSCSACTLFNPSSRTICDACGKSRYN